MQKWSFVIAAGLVAAAGMVAYAQSGGGMGQADPAQPAAPAADFESEDAKVSYAIGRLMGMQFADTPLSLDREAFMDGFQASVEGEDGELTLAQAQVAVQTYMQQAQTAAATENLQEAQAFLGENAAKEDVQVTDSGLQYQVIEEGEGRSPDPTDVAVVHYTGELLDGTVFDSSRERGEPAAFPVNRVVPGFSEGVQMMKEGGRYKFWIPPELGYGEGGTGPIGPNELLVFDVELIEVKEPRNQGAAMPGGGAGGGR
jgi:FKBP-type peptidyl-prolyl cis-trans isomerase